MRHSDRKSVVDAGRNADLKTLPDALIARAVAGGAFFLHHLAAAVTGRTGLHILHRAEHGLAHLDNLALPFTGRTGLGRGARLCAAALTGLALFLVVDCDFLLTAENRLFEGQPDGRADIRAAHRRIGRLALRASAAAEKAAEDIAAEHVAEDIAEVGRIALVETAAAAAAHARVKGSVSELIVLCPLLRIAQNGISFVDFLKSRLRLLVAGIRIRMILLREHPICLFQRRIVRVLRNPKHLIIIALLFCHRDPFSNGHARALPPRAIRFL